MSARIESTVPSHRLPRDDPRISRLFPLSFSKTWRHVIAPNGLVLPLTRLVEILLPFGGGSEQVQVYHPLRPGVVDDEGSGVRVRGVGDAEAPRELVRPGRDEPLGDVLEGELAVLGDAGDVGHLLGVPPARRDARPRALGLVAGGHADVDGDAEARHVPLQVHAQRGQLGRALVLDQLVRAVGP